MGAYSAEVTSWLDTDGTDVLTNREEQLNGAGIELGSITPANSSKAAATPTENPRSRDERRSREMRTIGAYSRSATRGWVAVSLAGYALDIETLGECRSDRHTQLHVPRHVER